MQALCPQFSLEAMVNSIERILDCKLHLVWGGGGNSRKRNIVTFVTAQCQGQMGKKV